MAERVRVALIGAGRIGQRHAATLASAIPRAELAIIADVHGPSAEALAAKVRCERWTDDPVEALVDPTIDAIVIASSTDSHAPLIVGAAEAGKQIFCEKPIALDLEATDRALDAVERAGVRLQMGFQRRFDKAYAKAKELIDAGALGRIEAIRDTMRDPVTRAARLPGNVRRSLPRHDDPQLRLRALDDGPGGAASSSPWGAPSSPRSSRSWTISTPASISLRFANDSLGVIDNSRRSGFGYDVRTEVFGSEGALMIGYSRDTPMLRLDGNGIHSDHIYWFLERFDQAYIDELQRLRRRHRRRHAAAGRRRRRPRGTWCSPTPPRRHSGRTRPFRPRASPGSRVPTESVPRRIPAWPSPSTPTPCS